MKPGVGVLWIALAAIALACAHPRGERYVPTRADYLDFKRAHPDLLEPNYLPFMLHPAPPKGGGAASWVLCRWSSDAMPLAVSIEVAAIPETLQSEIRPVDPRSYVRAVERALASWEDELEGLVSFRQAEPGEAGPGEAPVLKVKVLAEAASSPHPDIVVLGATEALLDACRLGEDGAESVHFDVPEFVIYAVDEFGLLATRQVEQIALHEIGHALGMLGHSPSPADLMSAAYRDHAGGEGLSPVDVNSFVSLYSLPNGTRYRVRVPRSSGDPSLPDSAPAAQPPTRRAQLAPAPFVAPHHGFSLRLPEHWVQVEGEHGVFAANGPIWDHDVSLEVFVWPARTIEEFLDRYGEPLLAETWRRRRVWTEFDGQRALELEVEAGDGGHVKHFLFIECPERPGLRGRNVMMVLAQAPSASFASWAVWFGEVRESLVLWRDPRGAAHEAR